MMTLYESGLPVREMLSVEDLEGNSPVLPGSQSGLPLSCRRPGAVPVVPFKRAFDVVLAAGGLLLLAPLLLALALAIRVTSPGPVILRQQRVGHHGQLFWMYKFRSMHCESCDAFRQASPGDPRVTGLGRLLRSRSLDELPQLLNVVLGDMSLVGPRPHVPDMQACGMPYADLVSYYEERHAVRPGMTGWAQANGFRGPTTDRTLAVARIDHDLAYIENASLWLDCRIVLLTLWREMSGARGS